MSLEALATATANDVCHYLMTRKFTALSTEAVKQQSASMARYFHANQSAVQSLCLTNYKLKMLLAKLRASKSGLTPSRYLQVKQYVYSITIADLEQSPADWSDAYKEVTAAIDSSMDPDQIHKHLLSMNAKLLIGLRSAQTKAISLNEANTFMACLSLLHDQCYLVSAFNNLLSLCDTETLTVKQRFMLAIFLTIASLYLNLISVYFFAFDFALSALSQLMKQFLLPYCLNDNKLNIYKIGTSTAFCLRSDKLLTGAIFLLQTIIPPLLTYNISHKIPFSSWLSERVALQSLLFLLSNTARLLNGILLSTALRFIKNLSLYCHRIGHQQKTEQNTFPIKKTTLMLIWKIFEATFSIYLYFRRSTSSQSFIQSRMTTFDLNAALKDQMHTICSQLYSYRQCNVTYKTALMTRWYRLIRHHILDGLFVHLAAPQYHAPYMIKSIHLGCNIQYKAMSHQNNLVSDLTMGAKINGLFRCDSALFRLDTSQNTHHAHTASNVTAYHELPFSTVEIPFSLSTG